MASYTRKRVVRERQGQIKMTDDELEVLLLGETLLDTMEDVFADVFHCKRTWDANKKCIMSLIGVQHPGWNVGVPYFRWGSRPWAWYKFEVKNIDLYYQHGGCAMQGDYQTEFNWLKANNHLLPNEEKEFNKFVEELRKNEEKRKSFSQSPK